MPTPELKISLENINKNFYIGAQQSDGFLSYLLNSLSGRESKKKFSVIKNVSFDVASGEIVGIIGKNGSGKSTLLRLIAGIYQTDTGSIKAGQDSLYINGYSIGLKQRLTMRDNIFLTAALMGLTRKETKKRFAEIVNFSELEEFLDTKICQFSYGMVHRLSFSIIINVLKQKNPEVILLDEVFGAGGDLDFHAKEALKMQEFINNGSAIIIVSHDLEVIKNHCKRAILLENGEIKASGKPEEIISLYEKSENL